MPTTTHGPFKVADKNKNTRIKVKAGDRIGILSSGLVKLGWSVGLIGSSTVDANGKFESSAGSDFPAPGLSEYSLICRVGPKWYQGGINSSFKPTDDGTLILSVNDTNKSDNEGGWNVYVYHTPAGERPPMQGFWQFETLDGGGGIFGTDVGMWSEAVRFKDRQHVFYVDRGDWKLRHLAYLHSEDFQAETLDGEGGTGGRTTNEVGWGIKSAMIHDERLHLFYHDTTLETLRHAFWDGPGNSWHFEVLDGQGGANGRVNGAVGHHATAVSHGSELHVFYLGLTDGGASTVHLRHARWDGTDWHFEVLDGDGGPNGRTEALVGNWPTAISWGGYILVFYAECLGETEDLLETNLRFAWRDGTDWHFQTLDGRGGGNGRIKARVGGAAKVIPHYTPLSYDTVHVFYTDLTHANLRHARWGGVLGNFAEDWHFEALDGMGGPNGRTKGEIHPPQIGVASLPDQLSVFYWDITNGNLRHAWWMGDKWLFETLDGEEGPNGRIADHVGAAPSVIARTEIEEISISVFYYDVENKDLRHAKF